MRKKIILTVFILLLGTAGNAYCGFFDNLFKSLTQSETVSSELSESTIISGLKEALSVGTRNAVSTVSQLDGYFGNQNIKIPMPEKLQTITTMLGSVGFQQQVDDFILSMNRAAERAAPEATSLLVDAITRMTITDAKNILNGGDTAATDFFRAKTTDQLFELFKPVIVSTMDEVGVTRYYRLLMNQYESLPFASMVNVDLDTYVTNQALDGLFYMVAQEEKKIREDPGARVTEILETVFGK